MLGAIIGDIVGSRFEFNNTNRSDFELFHKDCSFTDDTICTVAIADAILRKCSYQESLLRWCRSYPNPMGGYGGRFAQWIHSNNPQPYNSFGNGSAMRVSPVAWAFDNLDDVLAEAEKTASPTHNHPEGIKGAKTVAHAIWICVMVARMLTYQTFYTTTTPTFHSTISKEVSLMKRVWVPFHSLSTWCVWQNLLRTL